MQAGIDAPKPFRPLDPFGDVTVSKGFARREHAGTVDALPLVTDLIRRVAPNPYVRFSKGRRLGPAEVAASLARFGENLDALADVVGRYDLDVPATRARPKGGYHERARLCVSREDGGFRLVAAVMGIAAKRFHFEVSPTVVGWTRHAAERYYERVGGTATAGAFIGRALAHQLPIVSMAIEAVAARRGHCDLAIPAGGGLLLGQVHIEGETSWEGRYVTFDGKAPAAGRACPVSTLPAPGDDGAGVACWKALTYVGPCEMRPDQEEYAAGWLHVAERSGLVDDDVIGAKSVARRKFAPMTLRAERDMNAGFGADLAAYLDRPEYARIMRRTPFAPAPSLAFRATFDRMACLVDLVGEETVARGDWRFPVG